MQRCTESPCKKYVMTHDEDREGHCSTTQADTPKLDAALQQVLSSTVCTMA